MFVSGCCTPGIESVQEELTITGVVEKVEWLECGQGNQMVIKFEDGRYVKLRQIGSPPLIFQYGKEHTFTYNEWGRLYKMEIK